MRNTFTLCNLSLMRISLFPSPIKSDGINKWSGVYLTCSVRKVLLMCMQKVFWLPDRQTERQRDRQTDRKN